MQPADKGFEITGKTLDVETGSVLLLVRNPVSWKADTLATSELVDGNFFLKGKIDQPKVAYIRFIADVHLKDSVGNPFSRKIAATDAIIIENKQIQYESAIRGNGFLNHNITGVDLLFEKVAQPEKKQENLAELREKYVTLFEKASAQKQSGEDQNTVNETFADARMAYGKFVMERQKYQIEELNNSDDLLYKALILNNYGIPRTFGTDNAADLQQELITAYGEDNYHAQYIGALIKKFNINKSVSIGNNYKEVISLDLEGQPVKLSSKLGEGKYVLLEFWASWCAPCRKEIPNLKHDFAEYHEKGFDIFAISIDKKEAAWKKASKDEQLPWTNTYNQAEAGKDAQKLYNVSAIPANFLIGPDGKIIARNLRGNRLTQKLEELFAEK
jgi:thiol-disulfide isomerase/thioredoxin